MKIFKKIMDKQESKNFIDFFTSKEFPWRYIDDVAYVNDPMNTYYFFGAIYDNNQIIDPVAFNFIQPIIKFLESITEAPLLLYRVKINAYPRTNKVLEHSSHIDYSKKDLKAFVYMLNTNDGFTKIGDKKVMSEQNTGVLFNSNQFHNSSTCTDKKLRLTININFW
jgi:hypothetical protein